MMDNPLDLHSFWASLIVEELFRHALHYFCISPGSRSTPLTVAIARHPHVEKRIFYDERGAAFHALGYAKATGKTPILVCTSGTATANYLPAVIEASIDHLPLLILSADRPPELRETGANQTILQNNLFSDYLRWKFELPCPDEKILPSMLLSTLDYAVYQTQRTPAGPVHLNCMFREPLEPTSQHIAPSLKNSLSTWYTQKTPWTSYRPTKLTATSEDLQAWKPFLEKKRGLLLLGTLSPSEQKGIRPFLEQWPWPILADILSGFRGDSRLPSLIPYFDQILLAFKEEKSFFPEVLLHLGGRFTSKRLLQFIQQLPPLPYLHVKNFPQRQDPSHRVTHPLESDLTSWTNQLLRLLPLPLPENNAWLTSWKSASQEVSKSLESWNAQQSKLNEISVAFLVSRKLPESMGLFLGNSMPIRDMDMYSAFPTSFTSISANRGASGIDGNLASATGFANGLEKPVTVLLGDLTSLHDLNSFALLTDSPKP
jgi:2-succinyl-5-enolpyruvyl-6-hydroxy-3-cyclohexene-1-carboxylate synthase